MLYELSIEIVGFCLWCAFGLVLLVVLRNAIAQSMEVFGVEVTRAMAFFLVLAWPVTAMAILASYFQDKWPGDRR